MTEMTDIDNRQKQANEGTDKTATSKKQVPAAARRALAEAEARRAQNQGADTPNKPKEEGGPKGVEPTRFGDWERNGRAVDF